MKLSDKLLNYIADPSIAIDKDWMKEVEEKYPFFTLPATLLLSRDSKLSAEETQELTQWLSLHVADPSILMSQLRPEASEWLNFYPATPKAPEMSTNQAIDHFLDTYGKPNPEEEALLTKLIFNPTPDYAQILAQEEEKSTPTKGEAPAGSQDDKINQFILKSREQQGHFPSSQEEETPQSTEEPDKAPVEAPEENGSAMLSESLAKIYISQRRYAKAHEIIKGLSLNYPEKSIYFADQLRFLQKLMINQRHIDKK